MVIKTTTRANIIFTNTNYNTGDLTTNNKIIAYVPSDGYITYTLKEILSWTEHSTMILKITTFMTQISC